MEESTVKIFTVKNLDCAHCASKIEKAVSEMADVEEAVLTFTTKKFRIKAVHNDLLLEKIKQKCDDIEPGMVLIETNSEINTHHHNHEDSCKCDHDHASECHDHEHNSSDCICGEDDHHTEHNHTHEHHGTECRCCDDIQSQKYNEKNDKKTISGEKKDLITIISGSILLIAAVIIQKADILQAAQIVLFILSYLILGGEVLIDSAKSIRRGKVFNEKFLMSLATLAAFSLRDYPEAVGVMLFYRIGEFFEDKAVEKSRNSIMSAVDMRPENVNIIENDNVISVPAESVEPGTIILVKAGDRIPLDGKITEGESTIDTSSITGEHLPVTVQTGDNVLSGCINIQGVLKLEVTKPISESMVTKIINSVENAAAGKPKLDRFISRFASVYTPVVVITALITAIIPSLITGEWHKWIYTAVTFLVISCPCAIVLSVPLTFFAGIGAGSRKGILFKSGSSIEAVKDVKAVIVDKTGTITSGTFSVNRVDLYNGYEEAEVVKLCASCEKNSNHPVAVSIAIKAKEDNYTLYDTEGVNEFAGMGMSAVIDGKQIICGNSRLMKKSGVDIAKYIPEQTGTDVICAIDGKLAGCFRISDTVKSDSAASISFLKSRGIKTVMLTGDSQECAASVASETGIDKFYAKLMPDDKLTKMKEIRKEFGHVMFIGDGINDAPVLAGADVSAAMGSGADAAIEAADVVFMNSNMDSVTKAIRISYDTNKIARQNIIFALSFKLAVMILGLFGLANMWFAVFADSGVAFLCVLNSIRVLKKKY